MSTQDAGSAMGNRIRFFIKHSIGRETFLRQASIYGVGAIAERSMGFLLIPLYIRYLTPVELGALALIQLITDICATLAGLGISRSVLRFISLKGEDHETVIGTGIISTVIIGTATTACLVLASSHLANWIIKDAYYTRALVIGILTMPFGAINANALSIWRAQEKAHCYTVYALSRNLLRASVAVALVAYSDQGMLGVMFARLASVSLHSVIALVLFRNHIFAFKLSMMKEMVRYGLPLVPNELGRTLSEGMDRLVIQYLVGLEGLGLYSLARRFATVARLLLAPLLKGYRPFAFRSHDTMEANEGKSRIVKAGNLYTSFIIAVGIAVVVVMPRLLNLLDKHDVYAGAAGIIGILVLSIMLEHLYNVTSLGMFLKRRTGYLFILAFSAAGITLVGNIVLIPIAGVAGAAWAKVIGNLGLFVAGYLLSNRYYPIFWRYGFSIFALGGLVVVADILV